MEDLVRVVRCEKCFYAKEVQWGDETRYVCVPNQTLHIGKYYCFDGFEKNSCTRKENSDE